jgi:hypothetical protein
MAGAIDDLKSYLASQLIGPLVLPGDRVYVLTFYGKTEKLWYGTISNESDKASLIRSLHAIKSDGRFTDIGNALDSVNSILEELATPERPKYILLFTDERQEAPGGTKYYSADYIPRHPYLDYIKKQDLGKFRKITIGPGIREKVEASTQTWLKILSDPPERSTVFLPDANGEGNEADRGTQGAGTSASISGSSDRETSLQAFIPSLPVIVGFIILCTLGGCIALIIVRSGKKRKQNNDKDEKKSP